MAAIPFSPSGARWLPSRTCSITSSSISPQVANLVVVGTGKNVASMSMITILLATVLPATLPATTSAALSWTSVVPGCDR
jgi:hypothetical protein